MANTRTTAEVKRLRQLLAERDRTVETQQLEIERLKIQLARLRRWKFGRSSEQLELAITQIEMTLEALTAVTPQPAQTPVGLVPAKSPTRHRPARRALPAHLPRETLVHQADEVIQGCQCAACGGTLRKLGEDVAEVLELVPASFKVVRHVREKHACRGCSRIVQAAAPTRPIERGLAGPALLAHVINSKYGHHLPLYRQSEIYARAGMSLDRSTLAQWVAGCCRLWEPLVSALCAQCTEVACR